MILTHNAPASLERCLLAIASQSDPPAAVLVVDMASDPAVHVGGSESGIPVRVLRSDVNLGPAGGWAMAFNEFLRDQFDYAWVMDDDIVPKDDCLASLWREAAGYDEPPFMFPAVEEPDGTFGRWPGWVGFLIAKEIVAEVGVPNAGLFWWGEDSEYNNWRIPEAGHPRRAARDVVVRHDAVRHYESVPTWKYYYETRNLIYVHLYVKRTLGWFPRNFMKLMGRAFLRERAGYLDRIIAISRGVVDGVRGRLGIRYPVTALSERAHRGGEPSARSGSAPKAPENARP
jgi:GT2 family glycosyltransferase